MSRRNPTKSRRGKDGRKKEGYEQPPGYEGTSSSGETHRSNRRRDDSNFHPSSRHVKFNSSKVDNYASGGGKNAKNLYYRSSGKHGSNDAADSAFRFQKNARISQVKFQNNTFAANSRKSKSKSSLRNGEKGADAHTVSESYRIKFTELLLEFRESHDIMELKLPPTLTNTERKFIHALSAQLGLKSKSTGKNESRFITVTKLQNNPTKKSSDDVDDWKLPQLHLGSNGVKSLLNYIQKYPLTEVEMMEANLTGSSIDYVARNGQDDSLLKTLKELGIEESRKKQAHRNVRKVDLKKRAELHEIAQIKRRQHKAHASFIKSRSKLPASQFSDVIPSVVTENQVTIVSGSTGCGKSTQVPQFLLDDPEIGPTASIAVTQPRRISAITLADRVASERCEKVGHVIGYQVRLESEISSSTQCIFLTPGILLRRLISDPLLSDFNIICIDEVHERDQYTEFLLISIRELLLKRPDLRVIIMSATLQVQLLLDYFRSSDGKPAPEVSIPGRTFPVQHIFLEDILRITGFQSSSNIDMKQLEDDLEALSRRNDDSICHNTLVCMMCGKATFKCPEELGAHVALCDGGGEYSYAELEQKLLESDYKSAGYDELAIAESQDDNICDDDPGNLSDDEDERNEESEEGIWHGNKIFGDKPVEEQMTLSDEILLQSYLEQHNDEEIDNDLLIDIIKYIDRSSYGSGAILIFLPGWQEISQLDLLLSSTSPFNNKIKYLIKPLHSGVSSKDQRQCFIRPPEGTRKIILSTNIAETSVTIDDVAFVIDCGRMKEKSYDPHLNTSTLQPVWISAASAKQRAGRAGRTKAGVAFRLFSKKRFDSFKPFQESELLRTPLEEICLQCKKLGVAPGGPQDWDGIPAFLNKALTPPHHKSIENAIQLLVDLGAMDGETNDLTHLGHHLAALSVEPRAGKMVIWSYLLGCVRQAVAASISMSYKSPFFLPPFHLRKYADEAKVHLAEGSESDQMMLINCLYKFEKNSKRDLFCRSNFLSFATMQTLTSLRKTAANELLSCGLSDPNHNGYFNRVVHKNNDALLQASICAGLYPNIASRRQGEINFSTKMDRVKAKIHMSSVNCCNGQTLSRKCSIRKGETEFVVFGELVRGVSSFTMSQTTHLFSTLPLVLLCGELKVRPAVLRTSATLDTENESSEESVLSIDDGWMLFRCSSQYASGIVTLRKRLQAIFLKFTKSGADALKEEDKDVLDTLRAMLISAHNRSLQSSY